MAKREVDIVVISDVHLGTYGCHSKELLKYLKSIKPKMLILNGDIIDIWQFSKSYWPESHMKVVRRILKFVTDGVPVYYLNVFKILISVSGPDWIRIRNPGA